MSRIFAMLQAAAFCAVWMSVASQALAQQEFVAAGDECQPIANEEPTNGDLQSLLSRLEHAEAEILRQQQQLEALQLESNSVASGLTATGNWLNDGLRFKSGDGNFSAHFGGLAQLDWVGFANPSSSITSPDGVGGQESVGFRRLRLHADGTMYENIDWVFEFDFAMTLQNTDQANTAAQSLGLRSFPIGVGVQAGNTINVVQPTFVYLTFRDIPVVNNVRVGNQQDWFSLEHVGSDWFLDFMERSPLMDAFSGPSNNGFTTGISCFDATADKRATWQSGIYKNNLYDSGFAFDIGNAWMYGGRATWTPYYDHASNGRYLVHLGVGSEFRTFDTNVSSTTGFDNVRVRSRGDLRNAASTLTPNYADTGNFYATSQTVLDPELAIVWGPWLFQSEYTTSWFSGAKAAQNLPASGLGRVFMQGGYAEALVFLTGEQKRYIQETGSFGRVEPNHNANFQSGTWGAWQTGIRFDWLDLNSGTGNIVNGGNSQNMTLGLNWFLNPNARLQFNYVCGWVNNGPSTTYPGTMGALNGIRFTGDGTINSFGARLDFNF